MTRATPARRTGRPRSTAADRAILDATRAALVELGWGKLTLGDVAARAACPSRISTRARELQMRLSSSTITSFMSSPKKLLSFFGASGARAGRKVAGKMRRGPV